MLSFLNDWLNLLVRWAHLIAGVGWIGTSFYFIALDFSLKKRERMNEGVMGTAWQVHGGGFYHIEKYTVAPDSLPQDLTWFKWEAYLTWVTGFALLVVQFYSNPSAWMIDPQVMALPAWAAIAISVASLALGWFSYDRLCRSPIGNNTLALAIAVFLLIIAASWLYTSVFSGRSALIHSGAFIGTIMAVNVFGVIIPNQKKITASLVAGEAPDPAFGAMGKQRSLHNTYLTLPVLVLMVSGHYPMLSAHPQAWLIVALILVAGGCLRFFLVRHEVGDPLAKIIWTLPVIFFALMIAIWMTAPDTTVSDDAGAGISDIEALQIVTHHCGACHAQQPTSPAFSTAAAGVVLETVEDMRRYADRIRQQAVTSRIMPLGNITGMTAQQRSQLGQWLSSQ